MSDALRDKNGRAIGYVTEDSSRKTVRDVNGRPQGSYDSRDNATRDKNGRVTGYGDQTFGFLR